MSIGGIFKMLKEYGCWYVKGIKDSISRGYSIASLKCKKCEKSYEFKFKRKCELLKLKCDCLNDGDFKNSIEYHKGNMRLDYKAYRFYNTLKNNDMLGSDFSNYYEFKKCLLENGYKPWYSICRYDSNKLYTRDNIKVYCNKTSKKDISFLDVRSTSKSCHSLESSLVSIKESYLEFEDKLDKFKENEYIEDSVLYDIIRKASELKRDILKLEDSFKNLDIKFK